MKKMKKILLISSVLLIASVRLCFVHGANEISNKNENNSNANEMG